ncbi:MAG: phosphoenolpyruvate--protein phosphotransferase [Candidatus Omnitrophica bacterium]|nr:phosphoenolpyruvate--protein phosphotransferase [Candidatus Omnitrophota bacterium]
MLKGIPAAPGIVIGKAFCLDSEEFIVTERHISESEVKREIARFKRALEQTRKEIIEIQGRIAKEMGRGHAEIFNAHLLVIEDTMLIEEVVDQIQKQRFPVENVFLKVIRKYISVFSKMDDEYLKERISDIDDVGKRVLRVLMGKKRRTLQNLKEPVVIISYDLSPSDTAMIQKGHVIGFATDIGGRTSHTAIMAKSLDIPAVVGLEDITKHVRNGDSVIIDGIKGLVYINPPEDVIKKYRVEKKRFEEFGKDLLKLKDLPSRTLDGHRVVIAANIELPEELPSCIAHGAEEIGLYRSEYFYMNRSDLPTEDEQYEAYKLVARQMAPHPVIIRTLDLGGDKFLSQLEIPHEMNPFLGWRAIRFCLARPDVFKIQLRAILRASVDGKLKIMYPLISGVEELQQANRLLNELKEELRRKRIPFDEKMEVGAMIETPSAAMTCDLLAKEVQFFSIGTNDLIQYSLAIDRANEKIAYLYAPTHPGVLRLIKRIIDIGHQAKIRVAMCGEMASEPRFALLLLGMGLDEFSMSAGSIPKVKHLIRSVRFSDAQEIAERVLTLATSREVEEYVLSKVKELAPDLIEATYS